MSYRRKKLLALFCATALSMTAVAGCTGTKSSTGNVVSSETEVNAEETVAQSETGTFSSAAVYVKSAEKVFVTLAEGSQNTLRNTDEYVAIDDNNIDAVIFAKSDLTLNGTGSLTIVSAEGHGIVSKDDLKITGGTYDITAAGHALSGKDSVRIADGTFILTAEKDGIHAENADDEEEGYIYIAAGDFTITSDGDGMDASNIVQIEDGIFDITAGGGAANSLKTHESDMPGEPGGGMPQNGRKPDGEDMPEMGEKPDGENMPQDTTTDESSTSTKGIKAGGGMYLNGGTYQIDSADMEIPFRSCCSQQRQRLMTVWRA